jgi:hypothetical protein
VRALIDRDAEVGSIEARHFEFAAGAIMQAGDNCEHLGSLCAASKKLSAIAQAQLAKL